MVCQPWPLYSIWYILVCFRRNMAADFRVIEIRKGIDDVHEEGWVPSLLLYLKKTLNENEFLFIKKRKPFKVKTFFSKKEINKFSFFSIKANMKLEFYRDRVRLIQLLFISIFYSYVISFSFFFFAEKKRKKHSIYLFPIL